MSVLKVLTYIVTSITASPIKLNVILTIMYEYHLHNCHYSNYIHVMIQTCLAASGFPSSSRSAPVVSSALILSASISKAL